MRNKREILINIALCFSFAVFLFFYFFFNQFYQSFQLKHYVYPENEGNNLPFSSINANDPNIDYSALERLVEYSNELSAANGLIVMHDDEIVVEHYQNADKNQQWDIKSAAKSIYTGMLVRALDEGKLNLEDIACQGTGITIHHLASMSSGMVKEPSERCESDLIAEPGKAFVYSDESVNVLLDLIQNANPDQNLNNLLKNIMDPIGADGWRWDSIPGQVGSGLHATVRDLVKYGRLWLNKGNWSGQQVLSKANTALALTPANPQLKADYGYLWWVNSQRDMHPFDQHGYYIYPVFSKDIPNDAFLALGCTRTWILVIPSLDLVVARAGTGCVSIKGDRRGKLSWETKKFVDLARNVVNSSVNSSNRTYQNEVRSSDFVKGVEFDDRSMNVLAPGSDNWPITWAYNNKLYTVWGDGGGFGGTNIIGRVSLGIASISGNAHDYTGQNISSPFTGKSVGILALGNTLYMWRCGDESNLSAFKFSHLYRSDDFGKTWIDTGVEFSRRSGVFIEDDLGFFEPAFAQFGKGYSDNTDGYIYIYAPEISDITSWDVQKPGLISLMRVKTTDIEKIEKYQYFAGFGPEGNVKWTDDISKRRPTFSDPHGTHRMAVSYNSKLGRYFMTKIFSDRKGTFSLFESKYPWGPWSLVLKERNENRWGSKVIIYSFVDKWSSDDGKEFTMVYTRNDSFASIQGKFILE